MFCFVNKVIFLEKKMFDHPFSEISEALKRVNFVVLKIIVMLFFYYIVCCFQYMFNYVIYPLMKLSNA